VYRGDYAVGSPDLTQHGRWMAAVLASGEGAALSHDSALELFGIREARGGRIHVSMPASRRSSHDGIVPHRRTELHTTTREDIPVTTPIDTLFDVASDKAEAELEALINDAAVRHLITPRQLHRAAQAAGSRRGAAAIRKLLDKQTLLLTDTELERRMLRISRGAGLPDPKTQARVNGFRVDFHWPDLGIVVEADGGNYHRTPAQQTRDRRRDQRHLTTGLTPLRFTHGQLAYERGHVEAVLVEVVKARRRSVR
jgi:very-short-patch-repair endonuclease